MGSLFATPYEIKISLGRRVFNIELRAISLQDGYDIVSFIFFLYIFTLRCSVVTFLFFFWVEGEVLRENKRKQKVVFPTFWGVVLPN